MLKQDLTERQALIWNNLGSELAANSNIKVRALQYYLQYKEHFNQQIYLDNDDRNTNIFRIAYFLSEKTQLLYNMKGEKVQAVTLSINNILKKQSNFDDFIYNLKEMMKIITIEEKTIQEEINNFIRKFSFMMTFHSKFQTTFKKITIKPIQSQQLNNLQQSLLWLLFIYSRKICLQDNNDIISNTCLLACVFLHYSREKIKQVQQLSIEDQNLGGILNINNYQTLITDFFRIKDGQTFKKIKERYSNFLQILSQDLQEPIVFNQRLVGSVYNKLDNIYQKKLKEYEIDQRHFLKQRINNSTHINKFTPFGGRRNQGKSRSQGVLSHKILSYQLNEQQLQKDGIKIDKENDGVLLMKQLKFAKTPPQSIIMKATPMTQAMQLYNWLHQKHLKHPMQKSQVLFESILNKDSKTDQNIIKQHKKLIYGLWKDILANLTDNQSEIVYLVISLQITYYILNLVSFSLKNMVEILNISWYQIWNKFDQVMNYDKKMPVLVKANLLSIQTTIITTHLWNQNQQLLNILNKDTGKSLRDSNSNYQRLYKRIIHHIAYQIYFISKSLSYSQQSSDCIFLLVQHILSNCTELLFNRKLDQLILCSVYAIARLQNLGSKFNDIIYHYKQINNLKKQYYIELIEQVNLQDKQSDIITFYNILFLQKVKSFLIQIRNKGKDIIYTPNNNGYISSTMALLPKQININTPSMQALYAYNQSPLLKQKRAKHLQKVIGQGKNLVLNKKSTQQNDIQDTISLINKKFNKSKISTQMKFINFRNIDK